MLNLFGDKNTRLLKTIQSDDVASIQKLLSKGVKLNTPNEPLQKAIEHGNVEVLKTLLEYGSDLHEEDKTGRTVLERALLEVKAPSDEITNMLKQKVSEDQSEPEVDQSEEKIKFSEVNGNVFHEWLTENRKEKIMINCTIQWVIQKMNQWVI